MPTKPPDDITTPYSNIQTGNTCPECGKQWLDDKPTPGIIHRTRLCEECYPIVKARHENER